MCGTIMGGAISPSLPPAPHPPISGVEQLWGQQPLNKPRNAELRMDVKLFERLSALGKCRLWFMSSLLSSRLLVAAANEQQRDGDEAGGPPGARCVTTGRDKAGVGMLLHPPVVSCCHLLAPALLDLDAFPRPRKAAGAAEDRTATLAASARAALHFGSFLNSLLTSPLDSQLRRSLWLCAGASTRGVTSGEARKSCKSLWRLRHRDRDLSHDTTPYGTQPIGAWITTLTQGRIKRP